MKIKFHEIIFTVVDTPNITSSRIQSNVDKRQYTVDDILSEVKASDGVIIYDDNDNVIGVYPEYKKPIAVSIIFSDGIELISVEVENENIASQIESLAHRVDTLEQTYSEANPLIIEVPTTSGNTTTHADARIRSDMTILRIEDYYTGLEVEDVKVELVEGAIVVSNISHETTLTITLI